MGTWAFGAFDNDDAMDFLERAHSLSREIDAALNRVVEAETGAYVDVGEASEAWASAELVACCFGFGDLSALPRMALNGLTRLKPHEKQRLLALKALPRLVDPVSCELAELWCEGKDAEAEAFRERIAGLKGRLERAAEGAKPFPKACKGDVLTWAYSPGKWVVIQVLNAHEIAVFEGYVQALEKAEAQASSAVARRVPAAVQRLGLQAQTVAKRSVPKALRSKKRYAMELGLIDGYALCTARGSNLEHAEYAEACEVDLHEMHGWQSIGEIARGERAPALVRSVQEREEAYATPRQELWRQRRETSSPECFGDLHRLGELLDWNAQCGVHNTIEVHQRIASGAQGYGRPDESAERGPYAFIGLVALWSGAWAQSRWPEDFDRPIPPAPDGPDLALALEAAQVLIETVITVDSELRMIWEPSVEGTEALNRCVAELRSALA